MKTFFGSLLFADEFVMSQGKIVEKHAVISEAISLKNRNERTQQRMLCHFTIFGNP